MILCDSIIKRLRYCNVMTHCLPGATVPDILKAFPDLVSSLPTTVNNIILHIGTNDTARQESEVTKLDFLRLIDMINTCEKHIYLSGPISTHGRGSNSFSRILSLHTWLLSLCTTHGINYIDNFGTVTSYFPPMACIQVL